MVRGVVWILSGQAITLVCGFLASAIVARSLGPQGTGIVAITIVIPTVFALAAGGGLASANVFFAGRGHPGPEILGWNSVGVALVGWGSSAVVLALAATSGVLWDLLPGLSPTMVLVAVAILPILMLRQSTSAILLGLNQMSRTSRADMGQAIGYVGLIAGLVLVVRAGPVGALAAYLLALLGALCLTFRWLHMEGMRLHPHFDLASLRVALSYGYRGSVGTIVQFFTYRLDLLLVNLWVGTAAAGQYSVAARIGEMMWMLPSAVGAVVFTMSSASEGQQMNAIAPRAFWVTVAAGTLGALLIAALGPIGIPLVFSASFNGAYVPLLILLPGTVLLGASSVLANDLAGRGHPGWVSAAAALAFASTVGLDLLLIPAFGTSGAALASTISYIVYLGAVVGAYLRISAIGRGFLLLPIRHHAG